MESKEIIKIQEPVVISKLTTDLILKTSNPSDNMGLYWFLYQTAKWKGKFTYQASTSYIRKGLHWSKERVSAAKKVLLELGLIKMVHIREKGVFVKLHTQVIVIGCDESILKYRENDIHIVRTRRFTNENNHKPVLPPLVKTATNINSTNSIKKEKVNTTYLPKSSVSKTKIDKILLDKIELLTKQNEDLQNQLNNKESFTLKKPIQLELIPKKELITPSHFEEFYKLYPKQKDKGGALSAWLNLCSSAKLKNIRPEWEVVIQAIKSHKKSDLWTKEPKYIPLASTWINKFRWLTKEDELVLYDKKETFTKPKNGSTYHGVMGNKVIYRDAIQM